MTSSSSAAATLSAAPAAIASSTRKNPQQSTNTTMSLVKELFGGCICQGAIPTPTSSSNDHSRSSQFISIHGIEFIGLGAVVDELTAKERVYDTLEQLTSRTERLINIGYLSLEDSALSPSQGHGTSTEIVIETVPLDVWEKTYPNDQSMAKSLKKKIANITEKKFQPAIAAFRDDLQNQRSHPNRGTNGLLAGITAHNLGVLHVLALQDEQAIPLFQEAIDRKRQAFGLDHPEVAVSLDEIGIQYFAREQFTESLAAFEEARRIRALALDRNNNHNHMYHDSSGGGGLSGGASSKMAMVLNNIACCHFQMGHHEEALRTLQEARDILNVSTGTCTVADLDLLHVAITNCNFAYLLLRNKKYDEARAIFEEALLIQQSVLGDSHRAIRDTLSNIEFTNAFHS